MSMCTWSRFVGRKKLLEEKNAESTLQCVDGTVDAEPIRKYCSMIIICVHQSQNWTKGRNAGKHCFYCNGFNVPVKRSNESVEFGTKLIMLPWPYPQATSVFSS